MNPTAPQRVPAGAPWLALWREGFDDPDRSRLAQLATVSSHGEPEVRTVVLRGLSADGAPFFAADLRSAKIRAIRTGSPAELCLWWSGSGVQVRVRGPVDVIGATSEGPWAKVRESVWRQLRASERRGFEGPAPGTEIRESEAQPEPPSDPHPNFVLGVLTPLRFDRLVIGDPHRRELYRWTTGGWSGGRVHP